MNKIYLSESQYQRIRGEITKESERLDEIRGYWRMGKKEIEQICGTESSISGGVAKPTIIIKPEIDEIIAVKDYFKKIMGMAGHVSDRAKERLLKDEELLISVHDVLNNIYSLQTKFLTIKGIGLEEDPENHEWQVIVILIKIKESDYDKLFRIRDDIIDKAFEGIDIELLKEICIVNIF